MHVDNLQLLLENNTNASDLQSIAIGWNANSKKPWGVALGGNTTVGNWTVALQSELIQIL